MFTVMYRTSVCLGGGLDVAHGHDFINKTKLSLSSSYVVSSSSNVKYGCCLLYTSDAADE